MATLYRLWNQGHLLLRAASRGAYARRRADPARYAVVLAQARAAHARRRAALAAERRT